MKKRFRFVAALCGALLVVSGLWAGARQAAPAGQAGTSSAPPATADSRAEFMEEADSVLADMSKILSLPVLEPLKKSIRTRDQIRDYLVQGMKDDKDDAKRYADQRALEAFGLIPKGYPLDQKMLSLLTEQIAGLYDPKSREFFIADWTDPADQQVIMAHELTHALQDQHFHIQKWQDAVKSNDDASLARDAVLEGTATIAMVDYLLRGTGKGSRDVPDLDASLLLGDADSSPEMASAPMVIRDEMLFPYLPGSTFAQRILKAWNGWPDLHKVFDNPPASTQQILHPELYLQNVAPQTVTLAPLLKSVPKGWKKLDENVSGEFFLREILKQFLPEGRAVSVGALWAGDRYAVYEQGQGGPTLIVLRVRLTNDSNAARFFAAYSDLLQLKDKDRSAESKQPEALSFETPGGAATLRCHGPECLVVEGGTKDIAGSMIKVLGWPASEPDVPAAPGNGDVVSVPKQENRPETMAVAGPAPASAFAN